MRLKDYTLFLNSIYYVISTVIPSFSSILLLTLYHTNKDTLISQVRVRMRMGQLGWGMTEKYTVQSFHLQNENFVS